MTGGTLDTKQDNMILDGARVEKRKVYNRLRSEMPEVDSKFLEDAVDVGGCRSKDDVQRYLETTGRKENSERGSGERWLPSFGSFLGRGGHK